MQLVKREQISLKYRILPNDCQIELQSVFIRNRRVSHCGKLSPIFDVHVTIILPHSIYPLHLLQNIQNL